MHLRLLLTNQISSHFSAATSPVTTAMIDAATNTVSATGTSPSLLHNVILSTFASNPLMVGTAWMISSAIFTTYSTTKFIKYKQPSTIQEADKQQHPFWVQQHRFIERLRPLKKQLQRIDPLRKSANNAIQPKSATQQPMRKSAPNGASRILSPSSLLTMYRFAGSLLFGLLFSSSSTMSTIQQRFHDTITTIPTLLIPSICLFIANFSNTYVWPVVARYHLFTSSIVRTF